MSYVVYNTQDSSQFEIHATLEEATRDFWVSNGTVRDYNDCRFQIVSGEDWERMVENDRLGDDAPGVTISAVKPEGWCDGVRSPMDWLRS